MTRDPLNIGMRLTPEIHAALSAEVDRRTAADPDAGWTLSSVARSILRGALLGRPAVAPSGSRTTAQPNARAELQPALDGSQPIASPSAPAPDEVSTLDNGRQRPTTANNGAEVDTAAVQTSPVGVRGAVEALCAACGEGLWHGCTRGCGRRTRTCVCAVSVRAEGVCESCAQSSAPSVDLALTPPTGPRIAPDEVQDAARAEVLAWVAVDPKRTRSSLAVVARANTSNVLRWLAPGVRQRLPAAQIDAILAHIRANP